MLNLRVLLHSLINSILNKAIIHNSESEDSQEQEKDIGWTVSVPFDGIHPFTHLEIPVQGIDTAGDDRKNDDHNDTSVF